MTGYANNSHDLSLLICDMSEKQFAINYKISMPAALHALSCSSGHIDA